MKNAIRLVAVVAILGVVAAACGGNNNPSTTGSASANPSNIPTGGIMKMALVNDVTAAFDPAREYYQISFEFYKCCLLRTLYSTNGKPVDQGGADLLPDLATGPPDISSDGLTWTFSIKPGIHYAPPFQDVEITAQDFIRAVEREATAKVSAAYSFYYQAIQGFADFNAGKADTISGLTAVDDHTLQVKVTDPTGDLGWRFAMPAMAPIPPLKNFQLGAANGHDQDYGRYLVASGPYMFEGSDQMDFSLPPDKQKTAAGYIPGRQIVLVRNPSWDASTDDLRPAYVDGFQVSIGGDTNDLYNKVSTGDIDYVVDAAPPANVLHQYSTDPNLQGQLFVNPQNSVRYVSMNLAVPPFDDIHVRKAMNYIIDKAGARQLSGGPLVGINAGHIFPDGLINNILKSYDPYATPGDNGDVAKAQAEMKLSKYDTNHDGMCDASVCNGILALTGSTPPGPAIADLFNQDVGKIGMSFDIKALDTGTFYSKCNDLTAQTPICLVPGWLQDYPDAYTFGPPLFGGPDAPGGGALYPSCCNYSAVGATPQDLKKWGYSVTSVPSVDSQLNECAAKPVGDARTQCWADFDKYVMENVVPWVPRSFENSDEIVSKRVVNFSFDEFGEVGGYDHFALAPGA